jgi:hypothetical protein
VIYLRLDKAGIKNPLRTLEYYRQEGKLVGIRVSRSVMYPIAELDKFIAAKAKEDPR